MDDRRFETREVHSRRDDDHGAVTAPIHASATLEYETPTALRGDYRYARMAEPTRDELEAAVAGRSLYAETHDLLADVYAGYGVEAAATFAANLDVFALAESLGGVESLVEVPALMTRQGLSADDLAAAGIDEALVHASVGTEYTDDLLADLDTTLGAAVEA